VTNEHDPLAGLSRRELRELRARLDQAERAADAAEAAAPGGFYDGAPIEPGTEEARGSDAWSGGGAAGAESDASAAGATGAWTAGGAAGAGSSESAAGAASPRPQVAAHPGASAPEPATRPANTWDLPTEALTVQHHDDAPASSARPAGAPGAYGSSTPADATRVMPTYPDSAATVAMPVASPDHTRTEAMPFVDLPASQAAPQDPFPTAQPAPQDPYASAPTPPLGTAAPAGAPATAAGGAGDGSGNPPGGDDMAEKPRKSRRARNITLIVLLVLIVCVGWLGVRALMVKNDLQAAQRVVSHVQQEPDSLDAALPVLGDYAGSAASVRWDPIWRAAEFVPWAGANLKGVRLAAESLDVAANDLAVPALEAMRTESETPILQRVLPILDEVQPRITSLADKIHDVAGSSSLIGPVRSGVDMVDKVMQQAGPAIGVAPGLLGADGEKNYLLVFMNNAESVGLAGSAASQTLINVNEGAIEIAAQAGSGDFNELGGAVDVEVPQSALDLYTSYLVDHVNTTPSRPDFPTMAALDRAFWNRDIGDQQIDGVVGIDPIALSYILDATGPITIEETGDTLTSANAVQLLLSDVYSRWSDYESQDMADAFFAGVATKVFDKIATGDFDMLTMVSSLGRGIDQGSLLFHSFDEETQNYIAEERVSGILPETNEEESVVGVYFRDESTSKISYYMKSNIDVMQTCTDGGATFDVSTTLHLDLPTFDGLPDYVRPQNQAFPGLSRTAVYVYGPAGTTLDSVEIEGRQVEIKNQEIDDLGRPVAFVWAYLGPTEMATVNATFSGDGDFGPAAVWSTPMVNASTGTVTPCGATE